MQRWRGPSPRRGRGRRSQSNSGRRGKLAGEKLQSASVGGISGLGQLASPGVADAPSLYSFVLADESGRSAGRTHSDPVTIDRRGVVTCCRRRTRSLKRRGLRLFAQPCRSIGSLADALADQAVNTRYPNVISLGGDHPQRIRCLYLLDLGEHLEGLCKSRARIDG